MNAFINNDRNVQVINNVHNPEVSWWCKIVIKVAAAIAGTVNLCMGVWRIITLSPICLVAGIFQIFGSLIVLIFELPMCFTYLQFTTPISTFANNRSYFQRAIVYAIIGILPVVLCLSLSTIIGSILVFATGVLYGMMSLGKKADRDTMKLQASNSDSDRVNIINNMQVQP